MVKIFIISVLFLSTCCSGQTPSAISSDHIRIDHAGPIDKPIIPLVITTQKLNLPVTELSVLVNQNVFSLVIRYVDGSEDVARKKEINEFGVFKITEFINGETKVFFTPTRIKSIHFFKDIKKQLENQESSEKLIKEIDYIISRIKGRDE